MDESLVQQVEDLGLSEKEARIYVATLTLGPAPVQRIADYTGIKRVTSYVILDSLVSLGLMSQTTKGKKTLFIAEEPLSLRRLLDKKEEQLKDQKSGFDTMLPELMNIKKTAEDAASVRFYDSIEGIRSVMTTFYATHKSEGMTTVYGMSNLDQLHSVFPELKVEHSNPARIKAGLKSKLIYTSKEGPILKDTDAIKNRESRLLPADKFPLSGDFTIIGSNIVMLSLAESKPAGITIHSNTLAHGMKVLFDLAWDAAKKYNQ